MIFFMCLVTSNLVIFLLVIFKLLIIYMKEYTHIGS